MKNQQRVGNTLERESSSFAVEVGRFDGGPRFHLFTLKGQSTSSTGIHFLSSSLIALLDYGTATRPLPKYSKQIVQGIGFNKQSQPTYFHILPFLRSYHCKVLLLLSMEVSFYHHTNNLLNGLTFSNVRCLA